MELAAFHTGNCMRFVGCTANARESATLLPFHRPSLSVMQEDYSRSSSCPQTIVRFCNHFLSPALPLSSANRLRRKPFQTPAKASKNDVFEKDSPAKALRKILEAPGVHPAPACFDALSAKLVEQAGFEFCFMSGFCVSATRLALPDVGLISYGEMVDQGSLITGAVSIPVIGDGDNGYGNAVTVKRTIKGYIRAGFAGILLEDQVFPKACGHTQGRKVVPREEAVAHIKAAVDARNESNSDIVIIARTDARQAVSLEEALWRVEAFADAGADVLFIDALVTKEEMQRFCNVSTHIPKMINIVEGGGKTPILTPMELEKMGFKIISYTLSLLGVSIRAMQDALSGLKSGRVPPPVMLPSFEEIKNVVGFNDYYCEELKYSHDGKSSKSDENLEGKESGETYGRDPEGTSVLTVTPTLRQASSSADTVPSVSEIWRRFLRVKITAGSGVEKLDVRIPAGFLEGLTKIIPGIAGLDLQSMLDDATVSLKDDLSKGKKLIDFYDRMGDRIEVFLE
eukprot:TRINITY_DN4139_c0_g1_i1.p1 TRINITY_DN4139_c0_g1~~TRINITY_DN4139_c0_g1_i1.p1  ORF type:complete len:557 (-),score=126.26 TRINITY_DN4139_c0_g1_i1:72-1607(-)